MTKTIESWGWYIGTNHSVHMFNIARAYLRINYESSVVSMGSLHYFLALVFIQNPLRYLCEAELLLAANLFP